MSDIIRCKDCKYFQKWRTAARFGQIYKCEKLILSCPEPDDYCSKAEKKEDQKFGEWVAVSKRLPEEGRTVIASTEYGVYPETRYTKEYGWEWAYEAGADYWRELVGVTAWTPLPKLYEPNKSEDSE